MYDKLDKSKLIVFLHLETAFDIVDTFNLLSFQLNYITTELEGEHIGQFSIIHVKEKNEWKLTNAIAFLSNTILLDPPFFILYVNDILTDTPNATMRMISWWSQIEITGGKQKSYQMHNKINEKVVIAIDQVVTTVVVHLKTSILKLPLKKLQKSDHVNILE